MASEGSRRRRDGALTGACISSLHRWTAGIQRRRRRGGTPRKGRSGRGPVQGSREAAAFGRVIPRRLIAGERLLERTWRRGVEFVASGCMNRHVVERIREQSQIAGHPIPHEERPGDADDGPPVTPP